WVDAYDRSIASGGLSFGPVPRKVTEKGDVVGTYPVKSWDDESIDFWVGGVNVRLRVWKKGWQDKEGTLALTTKLLNLDAIAAWPKITDTR
ncbi:MAG: hypothetical protein HN849_27070, partial [Victivallales bacterium]|nr:hypothetical protein [Victivallales bacterium]